MSEALQILSVGAGTLLAIRAAPQQAGLIRGKRIRQWTFYQREQRGINRIKKLMTKV